MSSKTIMVATLAVSAAFLGACTSQDANNEQNLPTVKAQIGAHLTTHKLKLGDVAEYLGAVPGQQSCGLFSVRLRHDRTVGQSNIAYCPQ